MLTKLIVASANLAVLAAAVPTAKRDITAALPANADEIEMKFQPLLDFDTDGCYNTAAIDAAGNLNSGTHIFTHNPDADCRTHELENTNAYSRRRCNNGYCGIMYEYYFEKDQSVIGSGHVHEWENVIVFTRGDEIIRVAPSCHGGYPNPRNSDFLTDGTHVQIVYHKEGGSTHCFRFATGEDVAGVENVTGAFHSAPLVGWWGYPSVELRDKMLNNWSGGIGPKFDGDFEAALRDAAGDAVPGFDPAVDEVVP